MSTCKPGWDAYFMSIAHQIKTRSPDSIKVGAVLVSQKDHRIISTGYNCVCAGAQDADIDWCNRELIRKITIHAEANCILYSQSKFEDSTLYCTLSPCKECIKLVSATKINRIVYDEEYKDLLEVKALCKSYWPHIHLVREPLTVSSGTTLLMPGIHSSSGIPTNTANADMASNLESLQDILATSIRVQLA